MTTVIAGTPVKSGYYFGVDCWSIVPVARDGERLPGADGARYLALSLPIVAVAAPLLGAAFLMFMPFVGFYLTAKALARPVVRVFRKGTEELAATMSPGLVAGEAHLTGKRGHADERAESAAAEERELDALQSEIDARRAPRA